MHVPGCIVLWVWSRSDSPLVSGTCLPDRRSWSSHERCTAILVASMMILSVYMPHGGYDEENYIAELEIVKIIREEGTNRDQGLLHWRGLQTSSSNLRVVCEEFQGLDSRE